MSAIIMISRKSTIAFIAVAVLSPISALPEEIKQRGTAKGYKTGYGGNVTVYDYEPSGGTPNNCRSDKYACQLEEYQGKKCLFSYCVNAEGKTIKDGDLRYIYCPNEST